jgi:hypothetical protein
MIRPRISADLFLTAISSGMCRLTSCRMHPYDVGKIDVPALIERIGCAVIPDHMVERGFLFVDSIEVRRS